MGSYSSADERAELEEIWLARVNAARQRHEMAEDCLHRILDGDPASASQGTYGPMTVQEAFAVEMETRHEYLKTLRVFTGLVVYRKIPEAEAS